MNPAILVKGAYALKALCLTNPAVGIPVTLAVIAAGAVYENNKKK